MICVIPAKGHSRRIPKKNIRPFHGKPILCYSIETALASQLFTPVYVSTESEEVAEIAHDSGALVIRRPPELAEINAPDCGTQAVVCHVLEETRARPEDLVCALYPTAPLLKAETLRTAASLLAETHACYVVPVARWLEDPGQFYFGQARAFLDRIPLLATTTRLLPIPIETACDINTPEDWERAEEMFLCSVSS